MLTCFQTLFAVVRYVVDVLVHANIAVHEEGDRSHIKGHHTDHTLHVPSLMFLSFNPCKFDVTDQDVVDGYIQPVNKLHIDRQYLNVSLGH